jgi:hypothetical protein
MAVDGVGAVPGCTVGEIGVLMDITLLILDIGSNALVVLGARKLQTVIHPLASKKVKMDFIVENPKELYN